MLKLTAYHRDLLKKLGTLVLIAYLSILGMLFISQRSLVFKPDTTAAFDPAPEKGIVTSFTTEDGLILKSWLIKPEGNKPLVIFFHGNSGNAKDWLEREKNFTPSGFGFAVLEYRGYGGNPGQPSEDGLYKDATAFIKHIEKTYNIPTSRQVFYGMSLGTGVASRMSVEFKPMATILEAPYTTTVNRGWEVYPWAPIPLLMLDRFNNIDLVLHIENTLLIVHGDSDETIPLAHGQKVFEAANSPKSMMIITNGGHSNLYDHGAGQKIVKYLSQLYIDTY